MLHALKEFGRAIPRGEASINLKRVYFRKKFRNVATNSQAAPHHYHSQHGQDRFIDTNLLRGKRGGVFVDVGAYDGVALSNTCYFEKELGWTGLCIEPNPIVFERLTQNRNCTTVNCGVGGKD